MNGKNYPRTDVTVKLLKEDGDAFFIKGRNRLLVRDSRSKRLLKTLRAGVLFRESEQGWLCLGPLTCFRLRRWLQVYGEQLSIAQDLALPYVRTARWDLGTAHQNSIIRRVTGPRRNNP